MSSAVMTREARKSVMVSAVDGEVEVDVDVEVGDDNGS